MDWIFSEDGATKATGMLTQLNGQQAAGSALADTPPHTARGSGPGEGAGAEAVALARRGGETTTKVVGAGAVSSLANLSMRSEKLERRLASLQQSVRHRRLPAGAYSNVRPRSANRPEHAWGRGKAWGEGYGYVQPTPFPAFSLSGVTEEYGSRPLSMPPEWRNASAVDALRRWLGSPGGREVHGLVAGQVGGGAGGGGGMERGMHGGMVDEAPWYPGGGTVGSGVRPLFQPAPPSATAPQRRTPQHRSRGRALAV